MPLTYETSGTGTSGEKLIVNPDLSIDVSGKPTESSYNTLATFTLKAGTYTLRDYGTSSQDVRLYVTHGESTTLFAPTTFTLNEETYVRVRLAVYDTFNGNTVTIKPVFVRGSVIPQSYTQAVRHTLPIPEAVQALDSYGDGLNESICNYIDYEKKQFVKRVKKVVFDGSADENITLGMRGTEFTLFKAKISGGYNYSPAIINRDIPYKIAFDANDAHFYVNESEVLFALSNSIATDVATLKTHLASNPIEVIYELAEPIVTDISDLITADNLVPVQSGGTMTPVNEYGYAVPSTIIYQSR